MVEHRGTIFVSKFLVATPHVADAAVVEEAVSIEDAAVAQVSSAPLGG